MSTVKPKRSCSPPHRHGNDTVCSCAERGWHPPRPLPFQMLQDPRPQEAGGRALSHGSDLEAGGGSRGPVSSAENTLGKVMPLQGVDLGKAYLHPTQQRVSEEAPDKT